MLKPNKKTTKTNFKYFFILTFYFALETKRFKSEIVLIEETNFESWHRFNKKLTFVSSFANILQVTVLHKRGSLRVF